MLSIEDEAVIVAFRRHTLLPLACPRESGDCLYALQATIPHLTRSSLHRCLQHHRISRLREVAGDKTPKRQFKTYSIGYFHIDIAEVQTAKGKRACSWRSAGRASSRSSSCIRKAGRSSRPSSCATMLADALGRPLRLIVTAGQVGDITQAPALLDGQAGDAVLADKTYDSNALRAVIAGMGTKAVIPSNRGRKLIIPHDATAYKHRNRIERCFGRLKHFRRFATRYDRPTIHVTSFVHLAAAIIWLR